MPIYETYEQRHNKFTNKLTELTYDQITDVLRRQVYMIIERSLGYYGHAPLNQYPVKWWFGIAETLRSEFGVSNIADGPQPRNEILML